MTDSAQFPQLLVRPESCKGTYRKVDPEDRLPAQGHGQNSTKYESYDGAANARHKVDADRTPAFIWRKCVCQNCRVIGPDESCTYSLDETKEDQHSTVDR